MPLCIYKGLWLTLTLTLIILFVQLESFDYLQESVVVFTDHGVLRPRCVELIVVYSVNFKGLRLYLLTVNVSRRLSLVKIKKAVVKLSPVKLWLVENLPVLPFS